MPVHSADRVDPTEAARQELEKRKCLKSFSYFVNTYGTMWEKEGGDAIPFQLWAFQEDAAERFQFHKNLIVLKARQMGLSWLVSAYTLWSCMFNNNFHAYYVSIGLKEVGEQMNRVRFIFNNLPEFLKDMAYLGGRKKGRDFCKDNDSLIEFTNGSAIHAVSSGKSGGHGTAPGLLICDEWARVENDVEKWRALGPSRGKKTKTIIISTSDGLNNDFANKWFEAELGENGFEPVFYSADKHPDYTPEYLEEQRKQFTGDLQGYMMAFPMKPEDAFMSSSRSVFSIERIAEWKQYIIQNKIEPKVGYIDVNDQKQLEFVLDDYGKLQVWKLPQRGHRYSIGADCASGMLVQGDYSAAAVLDVDTNELVALFHARITPEEYAYPIEKLARFYNNAWLVVEVNPGGFSELVMQDLKASYPWIYCRQQRERITDLPTLVPGFVTTGTSKPRIIQQMRREFHTPEVRSQLKILSNLVLEEMGKFESEGEGKPMRAARGSHDDTVMAVALAIEGKTTIPFTEEDWTLHPANENQLSWRSL